MTTTDFDINASYKRCGHLETASIIMELLREYRSLGINPASLGEPILFIDEVTRRFDALQTNQES